MNRQLGTKWFTFYTKVRPWLACIITVPTIMVDFMRYQEVYTSYWWMMVCFFAMLVGPVLGIVVFVKSQGDYGKFVRFVKGVLLFEIINLAYSQAVNQYVKTKFDIASALIMGVFALLLGYFVWYRLNMKYFKRRIKVISNDYIVDATNCVAETNRIRFCRKCGEELIENGRFCRKCGTEIVEIHDN